MNLWTAIAEERLRLADELAALRTHDWKRPTVCELWDVKAVASHLILPFEMSKPRFALRLLRNRRDIQKTILQVTAKVDASTTTEDVIASLRRNATSTWAPPGAGPVVPLGEIAVHGQDIRRAVGIGSQMNPDTVAALLHAIDDPVVRADYTQRIYFEDAEANGAAT